MDTPSLESCPVTRCLQTIGGKWKPVILFLIAHDCNRFGALSRAIPGITKQMLTSHLRELEQDGVLTRTVFPVVPPRVEYGLTDQGRSLLSVVDAMRTWGEQALARDAGA